MNNCGILSIVATPIGNLEDITLRAIRVLKEVDYILCEDTRVTGKLLKHYDIDSRMKRYDAHTHERVHAEILKDLEAGKHLALVSDAGTPGVSDPGVLLIQRIRERTKYGHPMSIFESSGSSAVKIETIPGPSAVTAAFSIAGLTGNQFSFLGFVPQKKGRQTFFERISTYNHPVMFFESTHRIMKTLESLVSLPFEWKITVARELTKMHEELVVGTPEEVLQYFNDDAVHQKGEFVVLVSREE